MKPKYKYALADKASIPEALAAFYIEKDGFLILDVDGAADASRVAEFRTNNEALRRELEEIAAAATNKTPADFRGAKKDAILAEITAAHEAASKAGNAKTKQEIEEAANARIEALKTSHANALAAAQKAAEDSKKELSKLKIDAAVLEKAGAGLRKNSPQFLIDAASKVFSLDENGKIVARDSEGKQLFDTSTGEPLGIEAWVKKSQAEYPFLWEDSSGAGSEGGAGGGKPPVKTDGLNPWDKKTAGAWNLSEQGKLYKKDPALAIKMAAQHGVRLVMPAK